MNKGQFSLAQMIQRTYKLATIASNDEVEKRLLNQKSAQRKYGGCKACCFFSLDNQCKGLKLLLS